MKLPRNLLSLCFSQFGSSFSGNFVNVFLPFYILKVSPYPAKETLIWTGFIMGSTSLCASVTSTFWGTLTHRFSPKILFLRAFLVNTLALLLMGFTTNLYLLLLLRVLQGFSAGTSTIGLIIVSEISSKERLSSDIGLYQSSMTLGQLVGPLLGSLGVVSLGYRGAFVSASAILFSSFLFCYLFVPNVERLPRKGASLRGISIDKRILIAWIACFMAMIQLTFLPSVLPNVFERFHIERTVALKSAGIVVMLYTTTAMIGTYFWSRVSKRYGLIRMITFLFVGGILTQLLLALVNEIVGFTLIRMIQTGMIAATFPLVISIFAAESKGGIIGFLNSGRFAGNALGPIIATSILAWFNLSFLFFFIAALTFLVVLAIKITFREKAVDVAAEF
jgi:DHA1 family multidrug resistance protein-like MFS transporter